MARFQLARWRGPVSNRTVGGMVRPIQGLVLHIQQGTENGTDTWFHNSASQVSAHFGNPKSGTLDQWVDTDDVAWAEVAGNRNWISVENEGNSGDTLTSGQVANAALLLAWLNLTEGVLLQPADSPTDTGLGYHAMGGAAWGGHSDCPGQPIVNQRADIIQTAQQLVVAPSVGGINPASGPSGTTVVITGSGFTFATSVGFGGASVAQMSVDSDSQITVTAPNASGSVDVEVVTPQGTSPTSSADVFTYTAAAAAPSVTGVSPVSGPTAGGTQVVLTGSGFTGATSVGFGNTGATQMSVDSDSQITVTSPAGTGTVDIVVTTPAGTSAMTSADQFTYADQ